MLRKTRLRARALGSVTVGAALVLTAASGTGGASTARSARKQALSGTLTAEMVNFSWVSLDPAGDFFQVEGNQPLMTAIYGSMLTYNARGAIVPDLATSYHFVAHDMGLVVNLRHGVTFSDGTPFDSSAVIQSWDADLAFGKKAGLTSGWSAFTKGFKALGKYSVEIELTKPYPAIVPSLTNQSIAYVNSPAALKKEGATKFALYPVGAGPFEVASDVQNSSIRLVRNPHYWNAPEPYVKSVTMEVVSSGASALSALESHTAQLVWANGGLDTSTISQAKGQPGINVEQPPATWWDFLNFSLKSKVFKNPLAREAVWYATNAAAINTGLFGGQYKLDTEPVAPGEHFYDPSAIKPYTHYNLSKAKTLVKKLRGLSFTLYPEFNAPTWVQFAEALQREWEAAGMKVNIVTSQESAFLQRQNASDFDVELAQYGGSVDPALSENNFVTFPIIGAVIPAEVKLVDESENSASSVARQTAYNKLNSYLAENHLLMTLFSKSPAYLQANTVTGIPVTYNLDLSGVKVK